MKKKKIKRNVQCANNPDHIFEKVFDIIKGSEDTETEIQAYCPYCDDHVDITVQGIVPPDVDILKRFNLPEKNNQY